MIKLVWILAAGLLLGVACGGGNGESDDLTGLGVPGRAVYTQGPDIFFEEGLGGGSQNADPFLVADERTSLLSPTLSPNGRQIAYIAFDESVGIDAQIGSDLRILALDGEDRVVRESTETGEFFWTPRWSADGTALVYAHQVQIDGGLAALFTVELIDLASQQIDELAQAARDPDLAPDDASFVAVADPLADSRLVLISLPGGTQRTLATATDGLTSFRLPQFSPDGEWIAVLASGDGPALSSRPLAMAQGAVRNGVQDLWLIRPDGSGLRRLTTVLEDQPDFSWSSDGRHILLRGAFGTYVVEVESRVTTTLGAGEFHGWHDWQGLLPVAVSGQDQ